MTARDRMIADRRLRDSAKALLIADLEFLKGDLARKGLKDRAADRLKSGAGDVLDEARDLASEHRGALAALVAALGLWLARNPLLRALGLCQDDGEDADAEQGDPPAS